MARSLNKVMLIGNVGNDPETRTTASDTKVANVSLATNRQWKGRTGATEEKTEWHRLTFFGKLADLVEQYVKKGDRLYVEGRIEYSDNGKEGEERRYFTSIVVMEMVMLGGQGGAEGASSGRSQPQRRSAPAAAASPTASGFDADDEDLPF